MNKIVFTEAYCRPENLLPFTYTRQVQDLRVGILTIREKWERALQLPSFDQFEGDYKDDDRKFRLFDDVGNDLVYLIHGNLLPNAALLKQVRKLKPGECVSIPGKESIVYCISKNEIKEVNRIKVTRAIELEEAVPEICYPWDITKLNGIAIREDFTRLTKGRKSAKISKTNTTFNSNNIFIEEGARVECSVLNAEEGPIYIGKSALIMEGALLRGPLSIGDHAVVKMGTRIYGATTVGPYCTAGGEIKNTVFFGFSNKAHDGYVGDAVIGEWCNMGAGTSNSNIKNNAAEVQVWTKHGSVSVGNKCGMFMGDYSRTAINTSINTGTVIGVCCNVFGNGLTPKYIPNFAWGSDGVERYEFVKAVRDIQNWKKLKKHSLSETEERILKYIFDHY
jgi:UDP-N-acetylglucosamine diphosphorylase/glucosamine-1-phosphate N-acetyltransferase